MAPALRAISDRGVHLTPSIIPSGANIGHTVARQDVFGHLKMADQRLLLQIQVAAAMHVISDIGVTVTPGIIAANANTGHII